MSTPVELPNDTAAQAETWLLGGMFQQPEAMAQHAHALEPGDFSMERHRLVWQAMRSLHEAGRDIDVLTVGAEIEKTGLRKAVFGGKNDFLFDLMENAPPSAAGAEHLVEIIAKASALRKLADVLRKTLGEAQEPGAEADALVSSALERLAGIASKSARAKDEHIADIAAQVLESIRERMSQGQSMGASTGFAGLDGLTGGLRPGELAITGARTGMGKTSFALDIALHAAREMPVKFFSLEMDRKQIAPRVMSFFSMISLKRTINADLSNNELAAQQRAIEQLRKLNLYAEFEAGMSIGEICSEAHAFCAKHGKGLIVIDHLHYLRTDGKNYENRNIELGKITHALKELAKKLGIPILLLSQLNRASERAANFKEKSPRLSDLRDSGNIEQDADTVWFIHRPGYYEGSGTDPSETEIIVAKNRSGPTGTARLHFDLMTTKFTDAGR